MSDRIRIEGHVRAGEVLEADLVIRGWPLTVDGIGPPHYSVVLPS